MTSLDLRSPFAVLRLHRDLRLLLGAGLISMTGDWALGTGLVYTVYDLTGSTVASAVTLLSGFVPMVLVGLVAGVFVDRWDRKRTMIATNLMLAAALLPLLFVRDADRIWLVYVVMATSSVLEVFFGPAEQAMLPRVVPEEELVSANGLNAQARVARAVADRGLLELDQPITRHVPELGEKDRGFERITLQDLLDMRAGIAFTEEVHFPWINQDQSRIYYASDIASTSITQSRITSPPGPFTYNDFAPNLVGLALTRASGEPLADHMQALWDDLGAQDPAAWCVDEHGFASHESGLVATARDLARVGHLFLTDGIVADRRVAPEPYLQRTLDQRPEAVVADFEGVRMGYQNGWWSLPRPDGTHDIVAMGNLGQVMLVSPASGTVVVRMGTDHVTESNAAIAARLQRVAESLGPDRPIPAK